MQEQPDAPNVAVDMDFSNGPALSAFRTGVQYSDAALGGRELLQETEYPAGYWDTIHRTAAECDPELTSEADDDGFAPASPPLAFALTPAEQEALDFLTYKSGKRGGALTRRELETMRWLLVKQQKAERVAQVLEQKLRQDSFERRWGWCWKCLPCLPGDPQADMYEQGRYAIENVDLVIRKIPRFRGDEFEGDTTGITKQERYWLTTRWLAERNRLASKGKSSAFKYRMIGFWKVVCGVFVPAIVSYLNSTPHPSPLRTSLTIVSILVSVLGTLCTAVEDFYQYGIRATGMKTCVMLMDKEFWEWYSVAGKYCRLEDGPNSQRSGQAFQNFVRIIEDNVFAAQEGFLNTIQAGSNRKEE